MKRILFIIALCAAAPATLAQVAVATSVSEAEAQAAAVAANKNVQQLVLPTNPAAVEVKNVPSLGGMAGWAYAAPSGPCLGPSETTQGGAQAVWLGAGGGFNLGRGQSNLDWGCVILREMSAADSLCKARVQKACADLDALYEMLPGVRAIRAGALPAYTEAQVMAKPAPAPAAAPTGPRRTSAVQQPGNCSADPYIAARMGMAVCR